MLNIRTLNVLVSSTREPPTTLPTPYYSNTAYSATLSPLLSYHLSHFLHRVSVFLFPLSLVVCYEITLRHGEQGRQNI